MGFYLFFIYGQFQQFFSYVRMVTAKRSDNITDQWHSRPWAGVSIGFLRKWFQYKNDICIKHGALGMCLIGLLRKWFQYKIDRCIKHGALCMCLIGLLRKWFQYKKW